MAKCCGGHFPPHCAFLASAAANCVGQVVSFGGSWMTIAILYSAEATLLFVSIGAWSGAGAQAPVALGAVPWVAQVVSSSLTQMTAQTRRKNVRAPPQPRASKRVRLRADQKNLIGNDQLTQVTGSAGNSKLLMMLMAGGGGYIMWWAPHTNSKL